MTLDDILARLDGLRREHIDLSGPYPRYPACSADNTACCCGADEHNAKIPAIAADLRAMLAVPQPCSGAGTVPPMYQGQTLNSGTGWDPAACGICGQTVAVDGFMRTVTHPWRMG